MSAFGVCVCGKSVIYGLWRFPKILYISYIKEVKLNFENLRSFFCTISHTRLINCAIGNMQRI